jgi:hypothetical protein
MSKYPLEQASALASTAPQSPRRPRPNLSLSLSPAPVADTEVTDQEHIIREAKRLVSQDERLRLKLVQVFDKDFVIDDGNARSILMAHTLLEKYGEEIVFEKKSLGVSKGIVAVTKDGKIFCKSFLGKASGETSIIELFVYNFLQEMGCGPRIEAFQCCNGHMAFMVSHDFSAEGSKLLVGTEAHSLLKANLGNEVLQAQVIAAEIIAKMLRMSDMKNNLDNLAVVSRGETSKFYILDFNLNPPADEALTRSASALTFPKMKEHIRQKSEGA